MLLRRSRCANAGIFGGDKRMLAFLIALCVSLAIALGIVWVLPTPPHPHIAMTLHGSNNLIPILWLAVIAGIVIVIQATRFIRERKQEAAHERIWDAKRDKHGSANPTNFESAIDEIRAYREVKKRESERRYFGETITSLALVAAAGFAALQWATLEKTDQTLRAQQRAWIEPSGLQIPDNFRNFNIANTRMMFDIRNVGREPAQNMTPIIFATVIRVENINQPVVIDNIFKEKMGTTSCKDIIPDGRNITLFPEVQTSLGADLGPEDTRKALTNFPGQPPDYTAIVVGCIAYRTLDTSRYTDLCGFLEPYERTPGRKDWTWSSDRCMNHQDAD